MFNFRPAKENFIVAKYKDGKYCQKIDDVNIESLNNVSLEDYVNIEFLSNLRGLR